MTKWLLLLLFFPIGNVPVHDFHVSRVRMEYAANQQEWQLSLYVFIDDMEEALEHKGAPDLYLGTAQESEEADRYINSYLERYLLLKQDDEPLSWQWIGKEVSDDLSAFWIYLVIPEVNQPQSLWVSNRVLMDLYDDQQNMLQVRGTNNETKNYLMHQGDWMADIRFEK